MCSHNVTSLCGKVGIIHGKSKPINSIKFYGIKGMMGNQLTIGNTSNIVISTSRKGTALFLDIDQYCNVVWSEFNESCSKRTKIRFPKLASKRFIARENLLSFL